MPYDQDSYIDFEDMMFGRYKEKDAKQYDSATGRNIDYFPVDDEEEREEE